MFTKQRCKTYLIATVFYLTIITACLMAATPALGQAACYTDMWPSYPVSDSDLLPERPDSVYIEFTARGCTDASNYGAMTSNACASI